MESMHSSITPALRGNTASPSRGGDTTFQRGESPAGVGVFSGGVLGSRQAQGGCFPRLQEGKRSALLNTFFFLFFLLFLKSSTQTFGLFSKAALWFRLPCFKSNAGGLGLGGGREARRSSNREQMGCVSIHPYIN